MANLDRSKVRVCVASLAVVAGIVTLSPAVSSASACTIVGTTGDDVLVGTDGPDVICALSGNDTITGLGGDDLIYGGPGDDVIDAGAGSDTVWGLDGDDTIRLGDDTEPNKAGGGAGTDLIIGSDGPDTLYTGPGALDQLEGRGGNDTLVGHESSTTWDDRNQISGDAGDDVILSAGGVIDASVGAGNDIVFGSPYGDLIAGPGEGHNVVSAGDGDDRVFLGGPNSEGIDADVIALGPGNDFVDSVSDYSIVYGGDGDDVINVWTSHRFVTAVGGAGDDDLDAHVAIGGQGQDYIIADIVYAQDGEADTIAPRPLFTPILSEICVVDIGIDDTTGCQTES